MSADESRAAERAEAYAARVAAAHALSDLNHAFVAADGDPAVLAEVAEGAARLSERLAAAPRRDRLALMREQPFEEMMPDVVGGGARAGFEDRAVGGQANPTRVQADLWFDGDQVRARARLRRAFEGAPGRAHGGIVAALFDDVTGYIIGKLREPAFTGELTVRFVQPVPVEEDLDLVAWLEERDGRKLYIHGEARHGDTLVAKCRAIFITVSPGAFAEAPDPR